MEVVALNVSFIPGGFVTSWQHAFLVLLAMKQLHLMSLSFRPGSAQLVATLWILLAWKQAFISDSVQCPLSRWQCAFQVPLAMKQAQFASSVLTGVYNPDIEMQVLHLCFVLFDNVFLHGSDLFSGC